MHRVDINVGLKPRSRILNLLETAVQSTYSDDGLSRAQESK